MNLIELMKDEMLIYEKDGKYYSHCMKNEEITIEINNIISKFKVMKK